jgi:hypothetical protein
VRKFLTRGEPRSRADMSQTVIDLGREIAEALRTLATPTATC